MPQWMREGQSTAAELWLAAGSGDSHETDRSEGIVDGLYGFVVILHFK